MSNEKILISVEDADYLKILAKEICSSVDTCRYNIIPNLDMTVQGLLQIVDELDKTDHSFSDEEKLCLYSTARNALKKTANYAASKEHIGGSGSRLMMNIYTLVEIMSRIEQINFSG